MSSKTAPKLIEMPTPGHRFDQFGTHLRGMSNSASGAQKGKTMQPTATHAALEAEQERARRAQYATLTAHYGEIGSAALLAALMCAQQKRDAEQVSKAA